MRLPGGVAQSREIDQPVYDAHDIIGIDLGIKTLATCSDGQVFENPKPLKHHLKKIKRFARSEFGVRRRQFDGDAKRLWRSKLWRGSDAA
jgi:transposase